MRDLNHPDMQWAIRTLQSTWRVFTREVWFNGTKSTYVLTGARDSTERNAHACTFTSAERDLIVAHLKVLGF